MAFTGKADPALLAALIDDTPGTQRSRLRSVADAARSSAAVAMGLRQHYSGHAHEARVEARIRAARAALTTEQSRRTPDTALEPAARRAERQAERDAFIEAAKNAGQSVADARALVTALRAELRRPRLPKPTGDSMRDLSMQVERLRVAMEVRDLSPAERRARLAALPPEPSIESYELEMALTRDKDSLDGPTALELRRLIVTTLDARASARLAAHADLFAEAEGVVAAAEKEARTLNQLRVILADSPSLDLPEASPSRSELPDVQPLGMATPIAAVS